jgi:hypothetical protein
LYAADVALSNAVRREIERLGGRFMPRPPNAGPVSMPTTRGQLVLPEPLRCFGEVSWPVVRKQAGRTRTERLAYRSRDDDEPRGITFGLFDISEDYTGHGDDRPYVGVAIDEHYYMSIARIDGDCPDDPVVYRIDHEGYNEDLDRVGGHPLSEFLADLVPDPDYHGAGWKVLDPPASEAEAERPLRAD